MKKIIILAATLSLMTTLTVGCANQFSSGNYSKNEVRKTETVTPGIVVGKRVVEINDRTPVGMLTGGALGGVAGSLIGGNPTVHVLGAIGGALVGGVIGNEIDKKANSHQGYEYFVKLRNGSVISVVQGADVQLAINQRVQVIQGKRTRLVPMM